MTTRQNLLKVLEALARLYPHWRLAQAVDNLACWAGASDCQGPAELSVEALLKAAQRHLAKRFADLGINNSAELKALAPARVQLLAALAQVPERGPDGLGRLLARFADLAQTRLYDLEDEQFLEAVEREAASFSDR